MGGWKTLGLYVVWLLWSISLHFDDIQKGGTQCVCLIVVIVGYLVGCMLFSAPTDQTRILNMLLNVWMLCLIFSHSDNLPVVFLFGGSLVFVLIVEFFAWTQTRESLMFVCDGCQLALEVLAVKTCKVEETLICVKAGADFIMMLVEHLDGRKLQQKCEDAEAAAKAAAAEAAKATKSLAAAVAAAATSEDKRRESERRWEKEKKEMEKKEKDRNREIEKKQRCHWCDGHRLTKQNRKFFLDHWDGQGDADLYECSRCSGGRFKHPIHSDREHCNVWWR